MAARVTRAFMGRPDKEIVTRMIAVDEIIEGDLAAVAIREGWATDAEQDGSEQPEAPAATPGSKRKGRK